MKNITKHYKRMKITNAVTIILSLFVILICIPAVKNSASEIEGEYNYYTVYVNGIKVGALNFPENADALLMQARAKVAKENKKLVLIDTKLEIKGRNTFFGRTDSESHIIDNMYEVLNNSILKTREQVYTVKINQFTLNLRTTDEVLALLEAAKSKYDKQNQFQVELVLDPTRELNVLTTNVKPVESKTNREIVAAMTEAGAESVMDEKINQILEEKDIDNLGLKTLNFGETVEVVESYVSTEEVTNLNTAIELVTKEREKKKIYEVAQGDTLSSIASKNNTTIDNIIAINEFLKDDSTVIKVQDELVVTVPEPELSIVRQEKIYFEESYDAPVQYVDNDSWYTTQSETIQEPVAGHRKVVFMVTYRNDAEVNREVVWENVAAEAIPRIIERGTKIPPTYIKPLSGGRLSSSYKFRWGRQHKGVDWACPIGTAVKASCAGTVSRAGWGSGYGYVVYIEHSDGRQTRYGHLSKVLVKPGQKVNQGDKIALSGNTGRSTGPHVHFEILINGSAVNPFEYME